MHEEGGLGSGFLFVICLPLLLTAPPSSKGVRSSPSAASYQCSWQTSIRIYHADTAVRLILFIECIQGASGDLLFASLQFPTLLQYSLDETGPRLKHAIDFSAGIRKDVHADGKSVGKIIWDAI